MTSLKVIYDACLSKILEDEYGYWTEQEVYADMRSLLDSALPWFKFPRVDLTIKEDSFVGDLNNTEIQIIATYMKCEWINRTIATWENLKPLYEEKDFSHANLLDKLQSILEKEETKAAKLESIYYRSIKHRPYKYGNLAGGDQNG